MWPPIDFFFQKEIALIFISLTPKFPVILSKLYFVSSGIKKSRYHFCLIKHFRQSYSLGLPYLVMSPQGSINSSLLIKSSNLTHGNRLSVSSVHPKKAICRPGFAMAAPVEGNRLQLNVRFQQTTSSFKGQIMTYLFRQAYPPPQSSSPGGHLLNYNLA